MSTRLKNLLYHPLFYFSFLFTSHFLNFWFTNSLTYPLIYLLFKYISVSMTAHNPHQSFWWTTQRETEIEEHRKSTSTDFGLVDSLALKLHTAYQTITQPVLLYKLHRLHSTQQDAIMIMHNVHNGNSSGISSLVTL